MKPRTLGIPDERVLEEKLRDPQIRDAFPIGSHGKLKVLERFEYEGVPMVAILIDGWNGRNYHTISLEEFYSRFANEIKQAQKLREA